MLYPNIRVFRNFYNSSCVRNDTGCHGERAVRDNCRSAMRKNSGRSKVSVTWTRIPFNRRIARNYRVGPNRIRNSRDLVNVNQNNYKLFFRYIPAKSCILRDRTCVGKSGWRRFLSFSTAAINQGYARFLRVARIGTDGHLKSFVGNGTFRFDRCFKQFRLRSFANYTLANRFRGRAVATCIQDSQRYITATIRIFCPRLIH